MTRRSMMGSSKYEFEPEKFDEDYKSKLKVSSRFREDLREVIYREYKYHDSTKLSKRWKREIMANVFNEFIGVGRD